MRETNANAINQGWINLQEAGINIDRNELAATLLNELRQSLRQFEIDGLAPFIARWRALDNFIDRPVKLLIGEQQIFGIARGIDQQGALLLDQDGVIKPFIGGEISLRSAE
jgi:BirA family biotin operon repressor/biotin-[acetyl-CoA-carboxylase] ligase